MEKNTLLCYVSEAYNAFLYETDDRVPQKAKRPYCLLQPEENGFIYAVPLSTQEEDRFGTKKAPISTTLLVDPYKKENVGILQFHNMIPVPPEMLIPLPEDLFTATSRCTRQIRALRVLDHDALLEKARKVLDSRTRGNNTFLNNLAVDYRLCERRAIFYAKKHGLTVPTSDPAPRLPQSATLIR